MFSVHSYDRDKQITSSVFEKGLDQLHWVGYSLLANDSPIHGCASTTF